MKRIIIGCVLIAIVTGFLLLDILEHNLSGWGILGFCVFWYGLLGWMVYAGVRSRNKVKNK